MAYRFLASDLSVVIFIIINGSTYYEPLGNTSEMALQSAPKVSRVQRNGDDALVTIAAEELVTERDICLQSHQSALFGESSQTDIHAQICSGNITC
jgi:hypothetical protein